MKTSAGSWHFATVFGCNISLRRTPAMVNWVDDFMDEYRDRRRDDATNARNAQIVADKAPAFFKEITDRVEMDLRRFHELGGDSQLTFHRVPSKTFIVRHGNYPVITLTVELKLESIEYTSQSKQDDTCDLKETTDHFNLVAQKGNIIARYNGEFLGAAEIAHRLLKPVVGFVMSI
jgi:hypothetical protein